MSRKGISMLAVATVVSLVAIGGAAADQRSPTMTVKAADLDLADAGDVQTLYERVHAAATKLCRNESLQHYRATRLRAPLGWQERCVKGAVDAAVRDAGNPRLAALHH